MWKNRAAFVGGVIIVSAVGFAATFVPTPPSASDSNGPAWRAVKSEVAVGKGVRLELRLANADGKTAAGDAVTITSTRLDMGPDGMEAMTAPLRRAVSGVPDVLAFEADLSMAGRWALTLAADVEGFPKPVAGTVIFNAVEQRSKAKSAAAVPEGERKVLYYRNPMGLPDVSPVPKKDSMGMDYIPVYADEASGPTGTVRVALDKVQRAGVRTEPASRRRLIGTVRAAGTIVSDESRLSAVTVKFAGFVEKLFVATTGSEVRAGQPLMRVWIESPEILQKVSDYLIARRRAVGRDGGMEQAERNLRLFGIPDQAIEELRRTGEPIRSVVLTAPMKGTVMAKPAVVGMRFEVGETLFKIADHSRVWAIAQVAERDLELIRVGRKARVALRAFPQTPLEGSVAFVYPELDLATRTASLRIELPNPDGRLHIGLYADVSIETGAEETPVIAIPESAIIDNGTRRIAFVAKEEGLFEPRDLMLGRRGTGFVEVRKGVAEGERVVVSGNFLIDAESNLRAALAAFGETKTQQ